MMGKNLTEEKQLDFNQPLLSVRRISSTGVSAETADKKKVDNSRPKIPPLPVYKSELKSGPVTNPGTVPFLWEQTPGNPKNKTESQRRAFERPPVAPKLPPGRMTNVKHQHLDKGSVKTSTTILSQTRDVILNSQNISSSDKNIVKHDTVEEKLEERGSSSSEDGDNAYLDAVDTLSRTESFFMNCSVSRLSGLDSPDSKPSGIFSTDLHTRDFMMGRFLPAAKAMASETPQTGTRKQTLLQEEMAEVRKVIGGDKQVSINTYRPKVLPHYMHDICAGESEDEDDNRDGYAYSSAKGCGILPRFCFKSSFCLLNPVPGMRMQASAASSVRRVRNVSLNSSSGNTLKDDVNEKKPIDVQLVAEMNNKKIEIKGRSNQINRQNDCQKPDRSSLYRHLQGSIISKSNNQNELFQSLVNEKPLFGTCDEKIENSETHGVEQHTRGRSNFRELLANVSGTVSPVAEKTMYIDSVHKVKSPNSNSSSSDMKLLKDHLGRSSLSDSDRFSYNLQTDLNGSKLELYLIQDDMKLSNSKIPWKSPKVAETKKIDLTNQQPIKSSHQESCNDIIRDSNSLTSSKMAESGVLECCDGLIQNPITSTSSNAGTSGKIDLQRRLPIKVNSHISFLAPPSPKSPSESWLKRTLPAVSSTNSSVRRFSGFRGTLKHGSNHL